MAVSPPGPRLRLLRDLRDHLLGPAGGPFEYLEDSPRGLYVTGVLSPETSDPEYRTIPPDEPGLLDSAAAGIDEEEQEDVELGPSWLSPALNPDRLPRSFGLTFAVPEGTGLNICVSWGVYRRQGSGWRRHPRAVVLPDPVIARPGPPLSVPLSQAGPCSTDDAVAEVAVRVLMRRFENRVMVTVYVLNAMRGSWQDVERHVFQPQIRVRAGAELLSVETRVAQATDPETRRLEFLQRELTVKARGHLCSAVWKEIDPEAQVLDVLDADEDPFRWADGELLPEDLRRRFRPATVRTEFLPALPVPTPVVEWPPEYRPEPCLSAARLAECWEPQQLRRALEPLLSAYERWVTAIESRVQEMRAAGDDATGVAGELVSRCRQMARRMRAGMDLLCNDEDVRLAFCFANRAVELQHSWAHRGRPGSDFHWRPFQIAFLLATIESVVNPDSPDRDVCDLLWVPTGTGKTEAYLGLAAFTLAWRRRRAVRTGRSGAGTTVISRYTLRLLTLQQFRRTLRLVTACEFLRVYGAARGAPVGWRPARCEKDDDFIWGTTRFSLGLWVGGNVTPNRLESIPRPGRRPLWGALDVLKADRGGQEDPAQVHECPACGSPLAVHELPAGTHTVHLVTDIGPSRVSDVRHDVDRRLREKAPDGIEVVGSRWVTHGNPGYATLSLQMTCSRRIVGRDLDAWLNDALGDSARPVCARPSRPGYFLREVARSGVHSRPEPCDFDIFCPNPECPLNRDVLWAEGVPVDDGLVDAWVLRTGHRHRELTGRHPLERLQCHELVLPGRAEKVAAPDGQCFRMTPAFTWPGPLGRENERIERVFQSLRIPVPAYTVDEQVYGRCPSIVIATVDKFARLAFEPRAGAMFGAVDRYHPRLGYFRDPPDREPTPRGHAVRVGRLEPPDLIIQDELHLLEGPLGSLVGLYETAVDRLCRVHPSGPGPKYVASTATIRQAEEHVESLFARRVALFPPHGLEWGDRFFVRDVVCSVLDEDSAGRLYVGFCAPGRGPLTPLLRAVARLLQSAYEVRLEMGDGAADPYWTLVIYFNAVRELAGARALYRQDIPEWIGLRLAAGNVARRARRLEDYDPFVIELSSRQDSGELPRILAQLERHLPGEATDAVFATSMFGTGVDVGRLSLMLVDGQPKTTSAYVQASGRVGRVRGGLVVTFLRASRPRDLSHYEFFCGYHSRLHSFVEPVPVMPFSSGARARACGPVAVAIVRNLADGESGWHRNDSAVEAARRRLELDRVVEVFQRRAMRQPDSRRPDPDEVSRDVRAALDRWQQLAARWPDLQFVEYAIDRPPERHVVLGDREHTVRGMCVFENAPQSLREVEDTMRLEA
jgi:hypothetical protein